MTSEEYDIAMNLLCEKQGGRSSRPKDSISTFVLLEKNVASNWRAYEAFLLLIIALELFMVGYGILNFEFSDPRRIAYFSGYIILIVFSLVALVINRLCNAKQKNLRLATWVTTIYSVFLVCWGAVISGLDVVGGGYIVTFLTLLAAMGAVITFRPYAFLLIEVLSTGIMLATAACFGVFPLEMPFWLNLDIFLLVAFVVEARNYQSSCKQYRMTNQLQELANKDGLTKVLNRRSLDRYIGELIQEGKTFTFSLMDIDNFKIINDTFGHGEGDASLVLLADSLSSAFGDRVFRYGGDEFAIVSFEGTEEVARKIAEINETLGSLESRFILALSAGICLVEGEPDEKKIFEKADAALYKAKQEGKAKSVIA